MHNSVSSEVGNHFSQQSKGQLLGCPQHSPICKATKELGHKWGGGGGGKTLLLQSYDWEHLEAVRL